MQSAIMHFAPMVIAIAPDAASTAVVGGAHLNVQIKINL
jgi:hypothetical protein